MAQFLIYNKQHWTKALSAQDKAAWTTHEINKFAAVHEEGDIVEVREDGYWKTPAYPNGRNFRTDTFRVVDKPGLSVEKYKCMMDSVDQDFPSLNGKTYLQYRRRGKVDVSDNVVDKLNKISEVTLGR